MEEHSLPPFTDDLIHDDDDDNLYTDLPAAEFLDRELGTPVLDELAPNLHWFAKKVAHNIDSLHRHALKQRAVVSTEDPGLHLVWHYDTVYIKPLPPCLLNRRFWTTHLLPAAAAGAVPSTYRAASLSPACRAALGFLRSYARLVVHRSDMHLAHAAHLLPAGVQYASLARFLAGFRALPDALVATRYAFGQLRLTRLNMAVRVCAPRASKSRWFYRRRYWQTGQYVQALAAPGLFAFAACSLLLSSMQVVMQARGEARGRWVAFDNAAWGFAVAVVTGIPVIAVCVVVLLVLTTVHHSWQGTLTLRPKLAGKPVEEQKGVP